MMLSFNDSALEGVGRCPRTDHVNFGTAELRSAEFTYRSRMKLRRFGFSYIIIFYVRRIGPTDR